LNKRDASVTSVLDGNDRSHDVLNLYVVDASFFAWSIVTNPSLTIDANALRVAGVMNERLGESPQAGS
jgi:choline dehydrogenase-like flavoprotein